MNKSGDPQYVNCVNNDKRTALHLTVLNRQPDTVATLLKVGASLNIPDSQGDTPLQLAVIQGDHALLDLLLSGLSGGALLATNSRGHNVLHIACVRGDVAAVEKILREDRHMVNIVSREGEAALHLGSLYPPVVRALVKVPQCDLNIADSQGRTVLHWAAARLDPALLRLLVTAGASLASQDMLGNTPAHLLWGQGGDHRDNTASLYSNTMEDLLEPGLMNAVLNITNSQLEQTQLVLLLFLFKQGATNVSNYRNDTVTDLMENHELRRFVEETLRQNSEERNEETASDHEYAEIAEDILTKEEEVVPVEPSQPAECKVCNEILSLVTFLPCKHKVVCPGPAPARASTNTDAVFRWRALIAVRE